MSKAVKPPMNIYPENPKLPLIEADKKDSMFAYPIKNSELTTVNEPPVIVRVRLPDKPPFEAIAPIKEVEAKAAPMYIKNSIDVIIKPPP